MTYSPKHKTSEPKANLTLDKFLDKIICGDSLNVLKTIPDESIDCVITSPLYWALRDYGMKVQIGLEERIEEYLEKLIAVFDEVKRVLKPRSGCILALRIRWRGCRLKKELLTKIITYAPEL